MKAAPPIDAHRQALLVRAAVVEASRLTARKRGDVDAELAAELELEALGREWAACDVCDD